MKDLRRKWHLLLLWSDDKDLPHRPSTLQSNGQFRDNVNVHCTARVGWREIVWVVELRSDQAVWHLCPDERTHRQELEESPQLQQEHWSLRRWVELSSWNEYWSKWHRRRHEWCSFICCSLTLARDSAANSPAVDSSPSFVRDLLGSAPPTRKIRSSLITERQGRQRYWVVSCKQIAGFHSVRWTYHVRGAHK